MTKGAGVVTGVALVASLFAASSDAAAADKETNKEVDWSISRDAPPKVEGVEVAPLLGYASNNFGPGLGVRAGYTFRNGAYLGGAFMYHHGLDQIEGDPSLRVGMYYPSAEVGYDFRYDTVSLKPHLGGGVTWLFVSSDALSGTSKAAPIIYPGLTITYRPTGSMIYGGVDTRLAMPFVENAKLSDTMSVGVYALVGAQF